MRETLSCCRSVVSESFRLKMFLTLVLTGLGIVPWDLTGFLVGDLVGSFCLIWVSCHVCCKGGRSHGELWASQLPSCDVHSPPPRGAQHQEGWDSEGRKNEGEQNWQGSNRGQNRNPNTRPNQRQGTRKPAVRAQSTPLRKPVKEPRCQERARAAGPVILEGSLSFAELNPTLPPSAWVTSQEHPLTGSPSR